MKCEIMIERLCDRCGSHWESCTVELTPDQSTQMDRDGYEDFVYECDVSDLNVVESCGHHHKDDSAALLKCFYRR